jgi:hypothetical protein
MSTEDLAALTALHTDLATTLAGYVDGLETLVGTSNSSLSSILTALTSTIAGYVDGLEGLTTSSNTKLDTIHTDLGTTLSGLLTDLKGYTDQLEGYVDGFETLVTSSNTKLDTIHTDLATTLAGYTDQLEGYVDGLEGLATSTNTKLDTLHTDVTAATPAGTNLIGKVKTKFIEAVAATMTRPNDTTAYAANDAVANNTSAGSVTPLSFSMADVNDDLVTIERARVITTDTGFQGKAVGSGCSGRPRPSERATTPPSTAPRATFIGTLSGTMRTFSDGAGGLWSRTKAAASSRCRPRARRRCSAWSRRSRHPGRRAQSTWITTHRRLPGRRLMLAPYLLPSAGRVDISARVGAARPMAASTSSLSSRSRRRATRRSPARSRPAAFGKFVYPDGDDRGRPPVHLPLRSRLQPARQAGQAGDGRLRAEERQRLPSRRPARRRLDRARQIQGQRHAAERLEQGHRPYDQRRRRGGQRHAGRAELDPADHVGDGTTDTFQTSPDGSTWTTEYSAFRRRRRSRTCRR